MSRPRDPQAISDAVAASISAAIRQHGMSIQHVADASGIPYSTLRRKLAGFSSFQVAELLQISQALGMDSPADLIRDALGGDQ